MKKPILFALLAALAAGLFAGVMLWPRTKVVPPELETTLLSEPRPVINFQLHDQDGAAFGAERFQGKWSLVFFGYTHCPDVCPTTLLSLNGFVKQLKQQGTWQDDIQILFVSVDPKRDSTAHLKEYLGYFDPIYQGATGERAQIDALAKQFGAVYMFEGDPSGDDYQVSHSASIYVVDPEARLYARLLPPHEPPQMAQAFTRVREFFSR